MPIGGVGVAFGDQRVPIQGVQRRAVILRQALEGLPATDESPDKRFKIRAIKQRGRSG
jgi:hypothetical protein